MNLYTLLALGLVVYIARDLLRVWTETRAEATSNAALQARVATLEDALDRQHGALRADIAALREEQAHITTRLEHVETIVTHEAWERWNEAPHIETPPEPHADAAASEIAKQWAQRLRP